jgi:transcriptional regulator with XRE-family HTH domain
MNAIRALRARVGLTQEELANLGETSQPTIAAYEAGRKAPTLRTLDRLAKAVGLELAVEFVRPLTREDRRSLALHEAVAERLRESPGPVLEKARRNLRFLRGKHPHAERLWAEWDVLLDRAPEDLIDVLRDFRPRARELRHVTPFAGVLEPRERADVYRRFQAAEADR